MTSTVRNSDIFEQLEPIHRKYLPIITQLAEKDGVKYNEWDIPSTIKQLSYLSHSHYRYYGKFPSVTAGQILEQFPAPTPHHYVLDNFCGSGTTLVEAKLRNIRSFGLDISWLSVLASNVKCSHIDFDRLDGLLNEIVSKFQDLQAPDFYQNDKFAQKWFSEETSINLWKLQHLIFNLDKIPERDFLLIAFIGIVRRVSLAHNAEVRPHIQKSKKQRPVLPTFVKKVNDMASDHDEFQKITNSQITSNAVLGNNLNLPECFNDGLCYLAISHPPYLNSFNYAGVFNLEFYWGKLFESEYTDSKQALYKTEMKAHPASESITERYFKHLFDCYSETYRVQPEGGILAVVIGDCTRKGELIPVLNKTVELVKDIGYSLEEVNYRTTHYGLGKYAYKHRADYHGKNAEKKDGILIFRKPKL